VCFLDS